MLTAMIVLAATQIILRNVFQSGLSELEPLLRILVLWIGMLGAVVAAREDRHISIDVFSRALSPRNKCMVRIVLDLFVTIIAGLVAYHTARFVVFEYEAATTAFAQVPSWLAQSILPFAFGVITLRYLHFTFCNIIALMNKGYDRKC